MNKKLYLLMVFIGNILTFSSTYSINIDDESDSDYDLPFVQKKPSHQTISTNSDTRKKIINRNSYNKQNNNTQKTYQWNHDQQKLYDLVITLTQKEDSTDHSYNNTSYWYDIALKLKKQFDPQSTLSATAMVGRFETMRKKVLNDENLHPLFQHLRNIFKRNTFKKILKNNNNISQQPIAAKKKKLTTTSSYKTNKTDTINKKITGLKRKKEDAENENNQTYFQKKQFVVDPDNNDFLSPEHSPRPISQPPSPINNSYEENNFNSINIDFNFQDNEFTPTTPQYETYNGDENEDEYLSDQSNSTHSPSFTGLPATPTYNPDNENEIKDNEFTPTTPQYETYSGDEDEDNYLSDQDDSTHSPSFTGFPTTPTYYDENETSANIANETINTEINELKKLIATGHHSLKTNDTTNAIHCFKKAVLLSKNQNHPLYFAEACVELSTMNYKHFNILFNNQKEHIKPAYNWDIYALDTLKNLNTYNDTYIQALINIGKANNINPNYIKKYTTYNEDIGHAAYCLEALNYLNKNDNILLRIKALINLGKTRHSNGDDIEKYTGYKKNVQDAAWCLEALYLLTQFKTELNHNDYIEQYAQACIILGQAKYINSNNIEKYTQYKSMDQIAWFLKALDLLANSNNVRLRVHALIGLGNLNYNNPEKIKLHTKYNPKYLSATWFLEALYLLKQEDIGLRIQCYIGLGKQFSNLKTNFTNFDEAINYYQQALKINQARNLHITILKELGDVYTKMKVNITAIEYYENALKLNPPRQLIEEILESIHYNECFLEKQRYSKYY